MYIKFCIAELGWILPVTRYFYNSKKLDSTEKQFKPDDVPVEKHDLVIKGIYARASK